MRIIELFSGIRACSKALERLNIEYECVDSVEIDKFAIASQNAIFGTNFYPQDITKYFTHTDIKEWYGEVDLIMHGSPCQDFSVAGHQAGADEGTGTRSSLMYETIRIVGRLKPKYVIWENVKNILSKKHKHNFDNYLEKMEQLGYTNYYQVLNAKDYGIPQNRERIFTISILGEHTPFVFPTKQELKIKLKDILEEVVETKYYINDVQINKILNSNFMQERKRIQEKDYCDTLCARDWKDPKCIQIGNLKGGKWDKINESCTRFYDVQGISPTIHTCQGGNTEPKVGFISKKYNEFVRKNDYIPEKFNPYNKTEITDIAPTQTTECGSTTSSATVLVNDTFKIRKLTPLECWRLMGFYDEDFYKAQKVCSNSQLYKQAGNSIVVNVLEEILKNLLKKEGNYNGK